MIILLIVKPLIRQFLSIVWGVDCPTDKQTNTIGNKQIQQTNKQTQQTNTKEIAVPLHRLGLLPASCSHHNILKPLHSLSPCIVIVIIVGVIINIIVVGSTKFWFSTLSSGSLYPLPGSVWEVLEFQTHQCISNLATCSEFIGDAQWCTIGKEVHFHFLGCKARDEPCASVVARDEEGRFEWRRPSASLECAFHNPARSLAAQSSIVKAQKFNLEEQLDVNWFNLIQSVSLTSFPFTLRPVSLVLS